MDALRQEFYWLFKKIHRLREFVAKLGEPLHIDPVSQKSLFRTLYSEVKVKIDEKKNSRHFL